MTALAVMLIGFGALTVWAGFARVTVFDVVRSSIGAPVPKRDPYGKVGG